MRRATTSRIHESPGAAGPVLRLTPVADPRDAVWRDFAACAEADPEAWFPEKGGSVTQAKAICRRCPVQAQCLEYALATDQRFGIWGAKSERERRRIKQQRERDAA